MEDHLIHNQIKPLYIKEVSGKGRGVFCSKPIKKGEVIEISPIILIPEADIPLIKKTMLYNYYFECDTGEIAIALGYASIYNHSFEPNAKYLKDEDKQTIKITAIQDIQKDEEITMNYNGNPELMDEVVFTDFVLQPSKDQNYN
ncbi:MAG: SET domain-containing protein [Candidatus Hodarchaeota archaeon]